MLKDKDPRPSCSAGRQLRNWMSKLTSVYSTSLTAAAVVQHHIYADFLIVQYTSSSEREIAARRHRLRLCNIICLGNTGNRAD